MSATTSKVFRGDGDDLVDALVEACKPVSRPSLEGFGRTLTPYFGSSEPLGQEESGSAKPSNKRKGSPPNLQRTRPASSDKLPSQTGLSKLPRSNPVKQATAASTAVLKKKVTQGLLAAAAEAPTSSSSFACPRIFSSPKPCEVPLPSSRLLMRAAHSGATRTLLVAA